MPTNALEQRLLLVRQYLYDTEDSLDLTVLNIETACVGRGPEVDALRGVLEELKTLRPVLQRVHYAITDSLVPGAACSSPSSFSAS